jgi:hypothetical protein
VNIIFQDIYSLRKNKIPGEMNVIMNNAIGNNILPILSLFITTQFTERE